MDQDPCLTEASRQAAGNESVLAVSSRRRALDRLRADVEAGPATSILITGEPGAGKTWLMHQLAWILPPTLRLVRVDMTRATDPLGFFQGIGYLLGLPISESLGAARAYLNALLRDEAVDGRRWLLVVDEAHRAAPVVWDEIKAIVNQSGQPGGFAAIVILGDTELVRALATRDLRGVAPHPDAHLHLPPLDLDEARELLGYLGHDFDQADRELEELHRDARGNPRRLVRLAGSWPVLGSPGPADGSDRGLAATDRSATARGPGAPNLQRLHERQSLPNHEPSSAVRSAPAPAAHARIDTPSLLPAKPPLRVEEGLVEVGWDGDLDAEPSEVAYATTGPQRTSSDDSSFNEELIEDRYAALQAWTEWTKFQEKARTTSESPAVVSEVLSADQEGEALDPSGERATTAVRAEPQHDFAPYSQLFSRLRPSKQP